MCFLHTLFVHANFNQNMFFTQQICVKTNTVALCWTCMHACVCVCSTVHVITLEAFDWCHHDVEFSCWHAWHWHKHIDRRQRGRISFQTFWEYSAKSPCVWNLLYPRFTFTFFVVNEMQFSWFHLYPKICFIDRQILKYLWTCSQCWKQIKT